MATKRQPCADHQVHIARLLTLLQNETFLAECKEVMEALSAVYSLDRDLWHRSWPLVWRRIGPSFVRKWQALPFGIWMSLTRSRDAERA